MGTRNIENRRQETDENEGGNMESVWGNITPDYNSPDFEKKFQTVLESNSKFPGQLIKILDELRVVYGAERENAYSKDVENFGKKSGVSNEDWLELKIEKYSKQAYETLLKSPDVSKEQLIQSITFKDYMFDDGASLVAEKLGTEAKDNKERIELIVSMKDRLPYSISVIADQLMENSATKGEIAEAIKSIACPYAAGEALNTLLTGFLKLEDTSVDDVKEIFKSPGINSYLARNSIFDEATDKKQALQSVNAFFRKEHFYSVEQRIAMAEHVDEENKPKKSTKRY